jgi:integrase
MGLSKNSLTFAGIRRGELVDLRWTDIDFDSRCLIVRPAIAKSRKAREVPLGDAVYAMLVELREAARDRRKIEGLTPKLTAQQAAQFSREHVFVTKANTPLKNNLLTRAIPFANLPVSRAPSKAVRLTFTACELPLRPCRSTAGRTRRRSRRSLATVRCS